MRKTSHDGGDSTSITSGFENETRKTSVGIIKTKRNSIKRKVQNFSHESDDTVIEPLLQIDKTETINRGAKYLLSKSKTDSLNERENKVCNDNKLEKHSVSKTIYSTSTTTCNSTITIHNHMNTNIFGSHESSKFISTVKSPILVEINGSKATGNSNQTSSIFTTAKIHADSITKTMTPVQVTPLPILSTVEGNIVRAGISPDYSQIKNAEPSTSSNNSKSINFYSKSDIGKSDPSTESTLKNISTVLDIRPLETSNKSESKFLDKSCDPQKIIVTSVTNIRDTEIGNKIVQQPQLSVNKISEIKSKSTQDSGLIDSFRLRDIETKNEIMNNISSSNQNTSSVKTIVPKDVGVKKEDKTLSTMGGTMKQLQRQKNAIVEDSRDDIVLKNISDVGKFSTSTNKNTISKSESTVIADVERKQCSTETTLTKSKDKETLSTKLKPDPVVEKKEAKQESVLVTKKTPLVSNTDKEMGSQLSVTLTQSGGQLTKSDLVKGKKNLEKQTIKPEVGNTSISAGSGDENVLKSTVSVQPSQAIASFKPDISKDIKGSSRDSQKMVKDISSVSSNNTIVSKPAVTVQPIRATATFKSDFINKELDASSSRKTKSGKESTLASTTILKDNVAKPSTSVQPSLSSTKLKSDSVKEKKPQTDNFSKDRISSKVATTDPSGSTKVNSTKLLETTPVPKSVTTKAQTIVSDNTHVKTTIDSQPLKIVKSEITSAPSVKATTTNSAMSTNTVTVTKSDATGKQPSGISSSTKPVVVTSKSELSNKTLPTTSSLTTTNSTNSTLAKLPTSTNQSSKPKSTEKPGKM